MAQLVFYRLDVHPVPIWCCQRSEGNTMNSGSTSSFLCLPLDTC